jgi:hypothetical protein
MKFWFTLFFILTLSLSSQAQNRQRDLISANFENLPLSLILDTLSFQTDYFFSYNSSILEGTGKFTISAKNQPIDQFLSRLLVGTGLEYSFFKDQIILNYRDIELVSKKKNKFAISGTITDEKGTRLGNVNVFLDGTTIGTSSDIDGNFKLESIPPGYYDLVFSHVGYENALYSISEYNGRDRIQSHQMELDLGQLEEVEVISNRINNKQSAWQHYFLVFKEELLGKSENARNCVIENPEVIRFSYDADQNILKAYTLDPIQIRNDALGYRITYFLESFEKTTNDLRYRGQIKFKNDVPLQNSDKREWSTNRKKSFNGSFNHFRKALLEDDLRKEGFKVYQLKNLDQLKSNPTQERLSASDIIVFKGDHYELDFKNYLMVQYIKEKESVGFLTDSEFSSIIYDDFISDEGIITKQPSHQISVIKLLRSSVRLDLSGQVVDRFALTTNGYWSWERLADLVPVNYDPKLDNL